ncbi:hypothetical protein ACFP3Q_03680 [Nocardioides sp. GCM10027113]|uniref:hypothetical protein n=1 Tax=unclassified Nocardioides TaxID=2615069 RepID=UPI00360EA033
MTVRRGLAIMLSGVLGAAALVQAPGAWAGDGEPAKDKTTCSASSTVKLRVQEQADGRLETVGIVWSDDDDWWDWKFKHDGDLSDEGSVKAKDADRSFRIVRTMVNFAGPDNVMFRAENRSTGEVCKIDLYY